MKDFIIKIDRAVLRVMTRYTQRYVAWYEFKKHKIDLMIDIEWCMLGALVVWAILLPTALYVIEGKMVSAVVHALLWSMLGVFEFISVQYTIHQIKPLHDWIFAQREDPTFYAIEKESCERMFEEGRRKRLEQTAFMFAFTIAIFLFVRMLDASDVPNSLVWQYLIVNSIAIALRRYLVYVFDFDPPKSKKRAPSSISELLQRLWGETTQGFIPQPA